MCTQTYDYEIRDKETLGPHVRPSNATPKRTAEETLPKLAAVPQSTNCWHDLAINQFGSIAKERGGILRGVEKK